MNFFYKIFTNYKKIIFKLFDIFIIALTLYSILEINLAKIFIYSTKSCCKCANGLFGEIDKTWPVNGKWIQCINTYCSNFELWLCVVLIYLYSRSTGGRVYCFTSVRPSVHPRYFLSHFSQQLLMAEIWYLFTSFI